MYSACRIVSSGTSRSSASGMSTAGSTPQLPAVGAATMRFMHALHSATLSASSVTR